MPYKMKMSDGKEIDVMTMEEHNTALSAKETAVRGEVSKTIGEKEGELAKTKAELAKLSEKDLNFTALKEKADKAEADLTKLKGDQATAETKRIEDMRIAVINRLSGGNKILATKIAEKYSLVALPETTEAEILERAKNAFYIAAPSDAPKAIDSFMAMSGGRGAAPAGIEISNEPPAETPEQMTVRRKMGISDEDYKKYGAKAAALNKK